MRAAVLIAALVCAGDAAADPLNGSKTVWLETVDGDRFQIADLTFENGGYTVDMADAPFTDHFLSMRPFKCMEGPEKYWCHVPYPYDIKRQISANDLTDLEYDFLFLWKDATEYGIDMWNGVYYRLESGDDRLVGRLHEMDMGILSAPRDDGSLRPVRDVDLEESDPESHWLPILVIE